MPSSNVFRQGVYTAACLCPLARALAVHRALKRAALARDALPLACQRRLAQLFRRKDAGSRIGSEARYPERPVHAVARWSRAYGARLSVTSPRPNPQGGGVASYENL